MTSNYTTIYLVLGLPGAGKSRFIKSLFGEWGYVTPLYATLRPSTERICFDSLRLALGNDFWSPTEAMVHAVAITVAHAAIIEGRDVVVDESITTPELATHFANLARAYAGVHICAYVLDVAEKTCFERRVPQGFPEEDFWRKCREWRANRRKILELMDSVQSFTEGELVMEGDHGHN